MPDFFQHLHLNNFISSAILCTIKISKALNTLLEKSLTLAQVRNSQSQFFLPEWWVQTNNWDAYKLWSGSGNLTMYCNTDSYTLKAITLQNFEPDLFGTSQVTWIFLPEVCKSNLQLKETFEINNFSKVKWG